MSSNLVQTFSADRKTELFKTLLKTKDISFTINVLYEDNNSDVFDIIETELDLQLIDSEKNVITFFSNQLDFCTNNALCIIYAKYENKKYHLTDFTLVKISNDFKYDCIYKNDPKVILNCCDNIEQIKNYHSIDVQNNCIIFSPSEESLINMCLHNKFKDKTKTTYIIITILILIVVLAFIFLIK